MIAAAATEKMIGFYAGNRHDVAHFLKVWALARTIGELEGLDARTQEVLELAAVVHDIACPLCREKYGNTDGKNQERDYAILTLFLNCGLRISELVGLNLQDIQGETLRVLGKGNKVRILYLNDACQDAIKRYLSVRRPITGRDANALFLSAQNERVSRSTVHAMVKKRLAEAGLDASEYSSHKLRHTAATLMLQNGVDVRAVQEVLGHDHLNTTEIYTHIDNEALRVAAKANPLSRVKASKKAGTNE